jgi:hypothetical protein
MKLKSLERLAFQDLAWEEYELIILASGFEGRSAHILQFVPDSVLSRVVVLGFNENLKKLSRTENDRIFSGRSLSPHVFSSAAEYELLLKRSLFAATRTSRKARPTRVLVDYSVMTRAWYGYMLTWLRYSEGTNQADADFVYAHGDYEGDFEPLHIKEVLAIPGFEGACAGARSTAAVYGLGFDRYAMLALNEQIEPDSLVCFVAQESPNDVRTERALVENADIIRMSNVAPLRVPLSNLEEIYRILFEAMSTIEPDSEIVAVPMGPKPHVLGTLLVAQAIPRVTCLHAKGYRHEPVQVSASGEVSAWRLSYR